MDALNLKPPQILLQVEMVDGQVRVNSALKDRHMVSNLLIDCLKMVINTKDSPIITPKG